MTAVAQLKQEFVKALNSLDTGRESHRLFSDWLEITALTLHQLHYHSGQLTKDDIFQQFEEKYLEAIKGYSYDQLNQMGGMMQLTLVAHEVQFGDFLGEIAAENNFLNSNLGQIFTPHALCKLMAEISMQDAGQILEEKGFLRISDPTSGSGNTIIATADVLLSKGIDPRSCAVFDAIDVSRNAFNMCYIQLCALGLQANVRHGNTLSNEMIEERPTPQLQVLQKQLRASRMEQMIFQLIKDPGAFARAEDEASVNTSSLPVISDEPDFVLLEPQQLSLFQDMQDETVKG